MVHRDGARGRRDLGPGQGQGRGGTWSSGAGLRRWAGGQRRWAPITCAALGGGDQSRRPPTTVLTVSGSQRLGCLLSVIRDGASMAESYIQRYPRGCLESLLGGTVHSPGNTPTERCALKHRAPYSPSPSAILVLVHALEQI